MDINTVNYTEEGSNPHVIKCVIVGDKGVGKSHLVCSRACGTKYSLKELLQTHVSTVWAVDQYRTNPEVRSRSWCHIDGVNCSLHLWDTFGNHDKDRQFAYSSADVVIICFSVTNIRTLNQVEKHWMTEVKRFCPGIPIVLCACQIDLRYLFKDPCYIELEKGNFIRKITEADIVLPEVGKAVAQKIGAFYYETSVLVQYGIDDLFMNCVRAALVSKRRGKFLSSFGNLKNVVKPHLQVPHLPPKPQPPRVHPPNSLKTRSEEKMLDIDLFYDVIFIVQGQEIKAHQVYLVAASPVFEALFYSEFGTEVSFDGAVDKLKSISIECSLHMSRNPKVFNKNLTMGRFSVQKVEENSNLNISKDSVQTIFSKDTAFDTSSNNFQESVQTIFSKDTDLGTSHDNMKRSNYYPNRANLEHDNLTLYSDNSSLTVNGLGNDNSLDYSERNSLSVCSREYFNRIARNKKFSRKRSLSVHEHFKKFSTSSVYSDSTTPSMASVTESRLERDSGCVVKSPARSLSSSCMLSAFINVHIEPRNEEKDLEQVVVQVDESISPKHFKLVLNYLYTGELPEDEKTCISMQMVAHMMGLHELEAQLINIVNKEAFLNIEHQKQFHSHRIAKLRELFVQKELYTDVTFQLDDGEICYAHRCLLAAHCDMMLTMFTADFCERKTKRVIFPGVSKDAFIAVQEYLYTGQCPSECKDWPGVLELANRLCLNELLVFVEVAFVNDLMSKAESGVDIAEEVLAALPAAKLHNAMQLANWCIWYIAVDYKDISENHLEALESLTPEEQAHLAQIRWPPKWYLTETEIYEKALLAMNKMRPEQSWLRRSDGQTFKPNGCFYISKSKWKK